MQQHEQAFNEVKILLSEAPILKYYDVNEPVIIDSDNFDVGFGAAVVQSNRPTAYASCTLKLKKKTPLISVCSRKI